MKEDLSEITRSLARQLRAAADFLAPPPPPPSPPPRRHSDTSPSRAIVGVRNDFAEIGGGFRTGFAAISSLLKNSAEKEGRERGGEGIGGIRVSGVVGITEEVLKFVNFLSNRPEEWVQCPVPLGDSMFLFLSTLLLCRRLFKNSSIISSLSESLHFQIYVSKLRRQLMFFFPL